LQEKFGAVFLAHPVCLSVQFISVVMQLAVQFVSSQFILRSVQSEAQFSSVHFSSV